MLREFILGHNETGLVTNSSGTVSVVGGEVASLANTVMSGQAGIYAGSGTTQSTYTYPSATIAAWDSFIATAAPTASGYTVTISGSASPTQTQPSGASRVAVNLLLLFISACIVVASL